MPKVEELNTNLIRWRHRDVPGIQPSQRILRFLHMGRVTVEPQRGDVQMGQHLRLRIR